VKQLARPVAHRRWLVNVVLHTLNACAGLVMALLGSPAGWVLLASLPLAAVSWTGWWKTRPRKPTPDYARIAYLERELFGIRSKLQPPPGPGAATKAK
jgi:hypothetical protein